MKFRTTRKEVVNNYPVIISAGYCALSNLLRFCDPVAYTAGVYGWNFDVYHENGVCICTGYRNMPGKPGYLANAYEETAKKIMDDEQLTWDQKRDETIYALMEFCNLQKNEGWRNERLRR